jgi:hypothetical protein
MPFVYDEPLLPENNVALSAALFSIVMLRQYSVENQLRSTV